MVTLGDLPSEPFECITSFLTGFDLLRLSHACARFYHHEILSPNSKRWTNALMVQDLSDTHESCTRNDSCSPKEAYASSRSLRFPGRVVPLNEADGLANSAIGIVPTTHWFEYWSRQPPRHVQELDEAEDRLNPASNGPSSGRLTLNLWDGYFSYSISFDVWFCLLPASCGESKQYGGVVLGAQPFHLTTLTRSEAQTHQSIDSPSALLHVDTDKNIFVKQERIASDIQPHRWYHVAVSSTRFTGARIYLDGQFQRDSPHQIRASSGYLQVGTGYLSGSWHDFNGVIDQCRIWRGALSDDLIQRLAQNAAIKPEEYRNHTQRSVEAGDEPECLWSLKRTNNLRAYGRVQRICCTRPHERSYDHHAVPVRKRTWVRRLLGHSRNEPGVIRPVKAKMASRGERLTHPMRLIEFPPIPWRPQDTTTETTE